MSGSNHSDETPDYEQPTEPTRPAGYRRPGPERRNLRRNWPFFAGVLAGVFLVCVLVALLISQKPLGFLNPANPTIPQATPTQQAANVQIDQIRRRVADSVKPAIVQINVTTSNGSSLGSGIIIDRRGYIVTNNHVVENGQNVEVQLASGERLPAQVRGTDPTDDLAVLQIRPTRNMPIATLGDSSKVHVGETVMAIGNPLGITQTVTSGIISALNRIVSEGSGGAVLPDSIQTDAAINPGNSGGALVDLNGNVVGVPTLGAIDPEFKTPASGVGFAIPANRVKFIVPQIIKDGHVTNSGRAALGITALPLTPFIAQQRNLSVTRGLLVANIQPGGAADQAGIQVGDVITQIDNVSVAQNEDVSRYLLTKKPGDKVTVRYVRNNNQATALVTLGELQIPTT